MTYQYHMLWLKSTWNSTGSRVIGRGGLYPIFYRLALVLLHSIIYICNIARFFKTPATKEFRKEFSAPLIPQLCRISNGLRYYNWFSKLQLGFEDR